MKVTIALIFAMAVMAVQGASVMDLENGIRSQSQKDVEEKTWVVLVAGSSGWGNYRHQADVCHAYQTVSRLGVPADHIITMMYDDIAQHTSNPFKGKIYNEPGHEKDVYEGVVIDYRARDVTAANFMSVMSGAVPTYPNGTVIGTGRTLKSVDTDNVFLYFDDHGGEGLICFPYGGDLTEAKFTQVVQTLAEKKMYKNLILYIQACESGSMFYKQKLADNVYGVSSAPIQASAYAFNYDSDLRTYVASRWAYAWLYAADTQPASTTFQEQFDSTWDFVKSWSQPCQYGDLSLTKANVHKFFNPSGKSTLENDVQTGAFIDQQDDVPQWDVPYEIARRTYEISNSFADLSNLKRELQVRDRIDGIVQRISEAGAKDAPWLRTVPCDTCDKTCECYANCLYSLGAAGCAFECCNEKSCFERAPKSTHECTASLMEAFSRTCGADKHPYVMSAAPLFTRLCRHSGLDYEAALTALHAECSA